MLVSWLLSCDRGLALGHHRPHENARAAPALLEKQSARRKARASFIDLFRS
jgi:hypothetical protein